jgi:hypothetical protein
VVVFDGDALGVIVASTRAIIAIIRSGALSRSEVGGIGVWRRPWDGAAVDQIIKGKRSISGETAMRLGRYFGRHVFAVLDESPGACTAILRSPKARVPRSSSEKSSRGNSSLDQNAETFHRHPIGRATCGEAKGGTSITPGVIRVGGSCSCGP